MSKMLDGMTELRQMLNPRSSNQERISDTLDGLEGPAGRKRPRERPRHSAGVRFLDMSEQISDRRPPWEDVSWRLPEFPGSFAVSSATDASGYWDPRPAGVVAEFAERRHSWREPGASVQVRPVMVPASGQVRPLAFPSSAQVRPLAFPSSAQGRPLAFPSSAQVRPLVFPSSAQMGPVGFPGTPGAMAWETRVTRGVRRYE
jgi:hypothetical protein